MVLYERKEGRTLIDRMKKIKSKGFRMETPQPSVDYSKIKIGSKVVEDALYNINSFKINNPQFGNKQNILNAIRDCNYQTMIQISDYYYRVSGTYHRLCRYLAYMYCYDWFITPYVNSKSVNDEKVKEGFYKALNYLDNFEVKKFLGEVALKVIRHGCYYGYVIELDDRPQVQELPAKYCRSRFVGADGRPLVEFNMKYFDEMFRDPVQRMKIINVFPKEFAKGYELYKKGKLPREFQGDESGWYLLEGAAIKFNINGEDFPILISVIPAIIDLEEMQGVDKKKMEQQLIKILIQKMPIDKNGDLIFDVDEAQALHDNAVRMIGNSMGIKVLTTFADVEVADTNDTASTTAADEGMDRVKAAVYDQAGVSQMQFNANGNIALEKSIANDEATVYNLIQQFEGFLNLLLTPFNKNPKKLYYRAQILRTTIYNYKDLSKMYKEQTALGYNKMLPQLALGQSQSSILANAYFENDILELVKVFVPPMSSNTMNSNAVNQANKSNSKSDNASGGETGRPTKESQGETASDKTLANREAKG